ncbi:hypothetical protein EDD21DRAFT_376121 [Dissophora ornata]|nr:hypothetical protein EDD21DRAFT_376121 [Dissophora ornata]
MATPSTSRIAHAGKSTISARLSGFRPAPASLPRVRLHDDLSASRRSLVTSVPFRKRHVEGASHQDQHRPRDRSAPKPTTPSSSESKSISLSFRHRLRFLDGSEIYEAASQEQYSHPVDGEDKKKNESKDSTKKNSAAISRSAIWSGAKPGKRYRPGFQPGDFLCPQCGSHNFRPPERTLAATIEARALYKQKQRQRQQQQQQTQRAEATCSSTSATLGAGDGKDHDPDELAKSSSSANVRMAESLSGPETGSASRDEEQHPRRKYPIGANSHCFECGYGTACDPLPTSTSYSSAVLATASSSPLASRDHTQVKTATEATNELRADLRLAKPRDYVCPQCQTVNFNNRLHCVGCGVVAPWIRENVEKGLRASSKSAKGRGRHARGSSRV